jgi:energy-coupling factor transporter ATP-binding protein EcfA2
MKVESVSIRNFKRLSELDVSFKNEAVGEISDRFLVVGDNGSGKTTLLQAIALPLALAGRLIQDVSQFDWVGWLPGRFLRWGRPHIELTVTFTRDEIVATREIARLWDETRPSHVRDEHPFIEPGDSERVVLTLDGARCRAPSHEEQFQFLGRFFATRLLKLGYPSRDLLSRLPGIFWFDQFRNLASSPQHTDGRDRNGFGRGEEEEGEPSSRISFDVGVGRLRKSLAGWALERQEAERPHAFDWLDEMEKRYRQVFPDRTFRGVERMPGVDSPTSDDYYFLFSDGERSYDIVEMSAGEQAVFPVIFAFVQRQIARSVVLIDEIDLNLHPPAAQALVRQLPKLGPDCQFIFTTHSDAVSSVIGPEDTYRLPGGALCL